MEILKQLKRKLKRQQPTNKTVSWGSVINGFYLLDPKYKSPLPKDIISFIAKEMVTKNGYALSIYDGQIDEMDSIKIYGKIGELIDEYSRNS